jgi:hypothetical protein
MEELLFVFGHDSFKAPALNTLTRAFELRDFLDRAIISKKTKPILAIIDELRWSVHHDPAVEASSTRPIVLRLLDQIASAVSTDQPHSLKHALSEAVTITHALGDYRGAIETRLREVVPSGDEKAAIASLAASYVVQLEAEGYSKRFQQYQVKTLLSRQFGHSAPIDPKKAIQAFFKAFNGDSRKYDVFFQSSAVADAAFMEVWFSTVPDAEAPKTRLKIADSALPQLLKLKDLDAREPIAARNRAYIAVRSYVSIIKYFSHGSEFKTSTTFIVRDQKTGHELAVKPPVSAMLRGTEEKQSKDSDDKNIVRLSTGVHKLSQTSREFVLRALQYHGEALDSNSLENQLVDLWAAIEGFIPQPNDDRPRLTHYLDSMLPTLALVYPEKIFSYLSNALHYASTRVRNLILSLSVEGTFMQKCAALIVCPEFAKERDDVCKLLDDHPLLRYRMFRTYEAFCSPEKTLRTLQSHRKKMEWHLGRIYNSRNTIMHSATALPYLETLVENLHSYVDILLSTTVHYASKSARGGLTIKSILNLVNVYEQHHVGILEEYTKRNEKLSAKNYELIIFGANNPLCRNEI